ncbi:MAG TPA: ergothioneine biosynthesis protein EgtB, partial [Thermoanaerobaculia bacterium]|nr:ergothioneine biosynthesis protein EgtB [Thermoanaerobaculia bacterium]
TLERWAERGSGGDRLERIRERTLALVAPLDWPTLRRQHTPILSPMVWDLGHVANFEELWLVQRAAGRTPIEDAYGPMFDAMLNPRKDRERLPLPDHQTLFEYLGRVRERSLETLERWAERGSGGDRLLAGGFAFELVAQHEEQHQETILQALQTMDDPPYVPALRRNPPPAAARPPRLPEMVRIDAGPFQMGTDEAGFVYDNERVAHVGHLPAFWLDTTAVTQGAYAAFVEDGGYRRRELWSEAGWAWREEAGAEAPGNWLRDGRDGWRVRTLARIRPLPEDEPVVHVSYWEADAYARWAGKRLPTEPEWEKAATWDPVRGVKRRHPWGDAAPASERANVDQLVFGPAPAGTYPEGASAYGVLGLIGDVWEWTSTDFHGYPGFEAYPYAEYSEAFFGPDYKVLRGGSWATRPAVARGTFRNWDYPIRRQIFSGFRCARNA